MKTDNDILSRIGKHDGMTVPEGFFDDFAKHMEEWNRIRPYVYMAAMFAGIWCMLKMFTLMAPGNVDLSVENNPMLTEALGDENFVYDYIVDDITDREIFDEMFDDSISIDEMIPADELPAVDTQETSETDSEIE